MKRSETFYVNLPADTVNHSFDLNFNDRNKQMTFTGITCGNHTKGITLTVEIDGRQIASYDCSQFAVVPGMVHFDKVLPPQTDVAIVVQDLNGTGDAHLPVTFFYEIPQGDY